MSILRRPFRFWKAAGPPSAAAPLETRTSRIERVLSLLRSLLAAANIPVYYVDPTPAPAPQSLVYGTLSAFLLYSLTIAAFLFRRHDPAVLGKLTSILDICWISLILYVTGGFYSAFYLLYLFAILAVSARYGLRASLIAALASVALYAGICLSPYSPKADIQLDTFLVRTGYLFAIVYLFGLISSQEQQYSQELAAANRLAQALSRARNLDQVIDLIVRQAKEHLDVERAGVLVYEEERDVLVLFPAEETRALPDPHDFILAIGAWDAWETRKSIRANQISEDSRLEAGRLQQWEIRNLLVIPVVSGERSIGVLYAANSRKEGFTAEDEQFLTLLAAQSAPAMETVLLNDRLHLAIALEERSRIAEELHDSFLQSLSGLDLLTESSRKVVLEKPEVASRELSFLQGKIREAIRQVRQYLVELTPRKVQEAGLMLAAKALAEDFGRQNSIMVKVMTSPEPPLPPGAKAELLAVIREALTNIRKHAEARHVSLCLESTSSTLRVSVSDDGRGFHPIKTDLYDDHRLGLRHMAQRVRRIGGALDIRSAPSQGTRITVEVPLPLGETPPVYR